VAPNATVGFLHTSATHVPTFQGLLEAKSASSTAVHAVDESLLSDAQTEGLTADFRQRVQEHLARLIGQGAGVVVCTCSTIARLAEELSSELDAEVIRIDRPMAEQAVKQGRRIAVVAALRSTLEPTCELLLACAAEADQLVELTEVVCDDAWASFQAGDLESYRREVQAVVDEVSTQGNFDVVVLAQASMTSAASGTFSIPVLSSPALAVNRAVSRLA